MSELPIAGSVCVRFLGGCLIAWGANEIRSTSHALLAPNFRSACERDRIRTWSEGAKYVPTNGDRASGRFVPRAAPFVTRVAL